MSGADGSNDVVLPVLCDIYNPACSGKTGWGLCCVFSNMNANAPDPDDREEDVDPEEIDLAGERTPKHPQAPEVPPKMEALTEWDEPPDAAGGQAHKVLPEDEVNVAEELVEEGVEEADRDQRMASSDPDFEP